ncbi:MAG: hypothetical protein L0154_02865 [Chloroflexi bacterium]|nr:hypothetical protein [Chloroflexota bacterium]
MHDIWKLAAQLRTALSSACTPAFEKAAAEQGLEQLPVGMLFHAYDLHPEPLTAARIQACVPHYNTPPFQERILALAEAGLLHETGRGVYILTNDGYTRAHAVFAAIFDSVNGLELLPEQDLNWLADMLRQLADDSLDSLAHTPAADMAYHPMQDRPPMEQIVIALEVLDNFRCDAHFAAAGAYHVSPAAVEVFTLVWQGKANSLDSVVDVLDKEFPRGYSRDDYAGFAAELGAQRWLEIREDQYQLTDDGKQTRQALEDRTEELFFAVWERLTEAEQSRLHAMLTLLIERLKRNIPV